MEYLISYFTVGFLLAGAALMHGTFSCSGPMLPFVFTVLLWPLIVFFAPECFLSPDHIDGHDTLNERDALKSKLFGLAQTSSAVLTKEEIRRLGSSSKIR
ncbi:hypothetical protein [Methylobacter sp.]|uniref:hypothetical protein n=1 Tax=Methylobacter sp. TaxID=2051955 RepID=UPI002FDEFE26